MDPRADLRRSRISALAAAVGCVALDQLSKYAARALLDPGRRYSFLGDVFRLELVHNPGAFLSLGASLPPRIRTAVFTWGVLALVLGAAWAALHRPASRWVAVAAALVAGGGLGNLWDRLVARGFVTDFLNLGIGGLRTGVFNVADLAIVAGALILLFAARSPPRGAPQDQAPSAPT